MQAVVLIKNGDSRTAFQLQELPDLVPNDTEVRIKVNAFGLNFADVMARLGRYQDCPPLPTVIGYEAVGRIDKIGKAVTGFEIGQRVLALTRFGAYATQVIAQKNAVVPIPEDMSVGTAVALATQYCTAYYAAEEAIKLRKGEHVLVQSAAGGVGTALVQLAKHKGCVVYGTAGSEEKLAYLQQIGVNVPINYREEDFEKVIKNKAPNGKIDVVFDAVGGKHVKKAFGLLNAAGRLVCYGAASFSDKNLNVFKKMKTALDFGIYHPVQFMMSSKSIIGVNMLRIADNKPEILQHCLTTVVDLAEKGILKPTVGAIFNVKQLAEAHDHLASRQSIGKIVVKW